MYNIDKTATTAFAIIGSLFTLAVLILNQPVAVPSWPAVLNGVSFSPFRANQSPNQIHSFPTEEEVLEDLTLIDTQSAAIRTYSVEGVLGDIPRLAQQTELDVVVGVWLSANANRTSAPDEP